MRQFSMLLCLSVLVVTVANSASAGEKGWVSLMDGKTMNGWKASENSDSWTVEDGNFVCAGPRSHLFYVGDKKPFENFECMVIVDIHSVMFIQPFGFVNSFSGSCLICNPVRKSG